MSGQTFDGQIITDWLEFLKKKFNISHADAAREAGIKYSRIRGIKVGRTALRDYDLKKLAIAYPTLRERAQELGIDPNPDDVSEVMHLSEEKSTALGEAMLAEIKKSIDSKDARIEHLEAEVVRLHGIIDHLMGKASA